MVSIMTIIPRRSAAQAQRQGHLTLGEMRMNQVRTKSRGLRGAFWALAAVAAIAATGCQSNYNGQTLPSPWYMYDDVQYFSPGSEFKHAKEAAALQARSDDQGPRAGQP